MEGTNFDLRSVLQYSEGFFKSQTGSEMLSVENNTSQDGVLQGSDEGINQAVFQVCVGKLEIM